MSNPTEQIEVGFHAFVKGGDTEFGAIRSISPHSKQMTVYVENAGDFTVTTDAVSAVTSEKVIFDPAKLDARLKDAISHAHDAEDKNL